MVPSSQKDADASQTKGQEESKNDMDGVVEIAGDDEEAEQEELKRIQKRDEQRNNVARIRAKALMRRAKAKSQLGGWANLQGAEEDYKELTSMSTLPPDDKRIVQKALRELPAKINQAKDKEMADMMGKLKDVSSNAVSSSYYRHYLTGPKLGNGILSPFGLSTDNFKFVQDPKTGGYSMNFQS